MDVMSVIIMALVSALQCLGVMSGNILEGKTTIQSSTYSNYNSQNANDGNTATYSVADYQSNSYWEADLGGFYNVTNITVTSPNNGAAEFLRGVVIEIATSSMSTCPGSSTTFTCGQWPDEYLQGVSLTFNCTYTAVRYVRIRREVTSRLTIAEVAAEGVPGILPGKQYYEKTIAKKVTTPIKSLSVSRVTECGTMCSRTQPCIAFSYSKSQKPNCLLAVDATMTTDSEWIGYKVNECVRVPTTCPPIG